MTGDEDNSTAPSGPQASSWIAPVCLALALAVLAVFRLHAFDLPLEADECNYAYIGARLLEGQDLYVDVWDHQPFGVFALFAGVIALFGDEPVVFRLLTLVFSAVSLWLIFAILRRGFGLLAAVSGAFLFALASSDPGSAGEGCNREIYMNTFVLAAWYLVLFRSSASRGAVAGAGVALALGSAVKTILAIHWLFLAGYLVVEVCLRAPHDKRPRALIETIALFAAGPIALWLAALGYFTATGRASEFIDAVFLFNLSYAGGEESFFARFLEFFTPRRHPFIFDSALPLWIGGALALIWLVVSYVLRHQTRTLLIALMAAASFLAICLPGRFWPHYYYLLIPPLIIAVAAATHEIAVLVTRGNPARERYVVVLFSIVPILLGWTEYHNYLNQSPFGITVKRYNSRDFWGRAMGEKVKQVTQPGDRVFVYGSDTAVYYYSDRRCASRYTMITGISSRYESAQNRREILMRELQEDPPRVIIVLFDEAPFAKWKQFLDRHYGQPVGWDFDDKDPKSAIMFVMAAKDRPIPSIDWDWDRREVGGW